jgi:hypothetical protein
MLNVSLHKLSKTELEQCRSCVNAFSKCGLGAFQVDDISDQLERLHKLDAASKSAAGVPDEEAIGRVAIGIVLDDVKSRIGLWKNGQFEVAASLLDDAGRNFHCIDLAEFESTLEKIIISLKEAAAQVSKPMDVVVTVPSWFGILQRQITCDVTTRCG